MSNIKKVDYETLEQTLLCSEFLKSHFDEVIEYGERLGFSWRVIVRDFNIMSNAISDLTDAVKLLKTTDDVATCELYNQALLNVEEAFESLNEHTNWKSHWESTFEN